MSEKQPAWDDKILGSMRDGCVTFAWDDGSIETVPAPPGALEKMETAWEWIEYQLKEFEKGKGKPRSLCFNLANGVFRGLRFPDWNPGVI